MVKEDQREGRGELVSKSFLYNELYNRELKITDKIDKVKDDLNDSMDDFKKDILKNMRTVENTQIRLDVNMEAMKDATIKQTEATLQLIEKLSEQHTQNATEIGDLKTQFKERKHLWSTMTGILIAIIGLMGVALQVFFPK